jgi:membrane protein implicated in regulation of membrane protease activity
MASSKNEGVRTLGKYLLIEIPGWLVASGVLYYAHHTWGLSYGLAWIFLAVWIGKDLALYPAMRSALADGDSVMPADLLIGAVGVVTRSRDREGYVRIGAELWRAEPVHDAPSLGVGSEIRVREVRGLTLIVEPFASSDPP